MQCEALVVCSSASWPFGGCVQVNWPEGGGGGGGYSGGHCFCSLLLLVAPLPLRRHSNDAGSSRAQTCRPNKEPSFSWH